MVSREYEWKEYEKRDELLKDPVKGLKFILWRAFARAGGQQAGYGEIAVKTLDDIVKEYGGLGEFFEKHGEEAPERFWERFVKAVNEKGKKVNEKADKSRIIKLIKLAQESPEHNLFKRISSMLEEGNLLGAFATLRIGDKITPFILRDMVLILGIEDEIGRKTPLAYQVFLQPIDIWVERIAKSIIKDFEDIEKLMKEDDKLEGGLKWIIAYRIIEKCREYGYSPLRFNQGAWVYGSSHIEEKKRVQECLERIVEGDPC